MSVQPSAMYQPGDVVRRNLTLERRETPDGVRFQEQDGERVLVRRQGEKWVPVESLPGEVSHRELAENFRLWKDEPVALPKKRLQRYGDGDKVVQPRELTTLFPSKRWIQTRQANECGWDTTWNPEFHVGNLEDVSLRPAPLGTFATLQGDYRLSEQNEFLPRGGSLPSLAD